MSRLARHPRAAAFALRSLRLLPSAVRSYAFRSLSWPLARRLSTELDVKVVAGSTMRVHTADAVGRTLAVSGVWEPNVTAEFVRALAPGDICVDVGAHIGYFTLLAAKLVGPGGHVYSFEPSPANYRVLIDNLKRNDAGNVTAIDAAVGAGPRRAVLYEGTGTNTGRATLDERIAGRAATEERSVAVEVKTIAATVPARRFPRIRVVKIDVEGAEIDVLHSLEPIFRAAHPLTVFLEVNPKWLASADAEYVARVCRTHGFKLSRLRTGYELEDLFPRSLIPAVPVDDLPEQLSDLLLTR
jgi:FkbM family methyltransferase